MSKPPPVIDFESYYDKEISVSEIGVPNYVARSDAYIVAVVRGDEGWCGEIGDLPTKCPEGLLPDPNTDTAIAANSNFDRALWNKYYTELKHPWFCVLDQAAVAQMPRDLAGAARVVMGSKVDKTIRDEMRGVRWSSLSEDRKKEVIAYCLNDSLEEAKLHVALPKMSSFEEKVAIQTRAMNDRGVAINVEAVDRGVTALQMARHAALKAIPWTSVDLPPLSYPHFVTYCGKHGVPAPKSLAKDDLECAEWEKTYPIQGTVLRSMREFRKANTMLKKLEAMKSRLVGNILPLELIYCGAPHTRRWSCRGFNVQNLDKEGVHFDVPGLAEELSTIHMRPFIVPRPGKKFLIIDLSQIEPRCLWWLIQDEVALEGARRGVAIYETHARATMNWTGGVLKKEDPEKYKLAKARVLGLGYGCGADKFEALAWKVAELKLTPVECQAAVDGFRHSNPKVTGFWKLFDQQLKDANLSKERNLVVEMPTGELLTYFNVHRSLKSGMVANKVKGSPKDVHHHLWGGHITENVTQRMARDVFAGHQLELERRGLCPVFSSHDEAVLEVDADRAEEGLREAIEVLTIPPDWAPDLPLAAEGGIYDHYTK